MKTALLCLLLLALGVAILEWRRRRVRRRARTLTRLLDGADAVERLLYRTRERMGAMHGVLGRVPDDIGAAARASLDSEQAVQDALRDVLQHRLWIDRHGSEATQAELDTACDAMERARSRIGDELARLDRAAAALTRATDEALEAAAREPAALRRRQ
ncbi:hypothetical protein [Coralloluteibacterium thermophilus]|uniref:Uncharacterized protein n=1 Tax=Coralloluteibacterium thermophilum TaxID=2707049 RepID=A0ABV9NJC7_9GAMM